MKKEPNIHLCEKWLHVLGSDGGTSQMLEFHCKTWGPRPASLRLLFNIHLSVLVWLVWEEIMMRGNPLHWLLVTFKISLKSWLLLLWHYEVRPDISRSSPSLSPNWIRMFADRGLLVAARSRLKTKMGWTYSCRLSQWAVPQASPCTR